MFFCYVATNAQTEITNIVHQSESGAPILEGFVIKQPEETGFAVLLNDGRSLYLNSFDGNFNYLNHLTVNPPAGRSSFVASTATADGNYHLLYKSARNPLLTRQTVNLSNESVTTHTTDLNLLDQEILGTYGDSDGLHILTASKHQPKIFHHLLSPNFEGTSQLFDLSELSFQLGNESVPFHELFFEQWREFYSLGFDGASVFPTALPEATRTSKVFRQGSRFVFTVDRNAGSTQLLTIDIINGEIGTQVISQREVVSEKNIRQSNSYLKDSVLYQMVRTNDSLHLMATNWVTGNAVNSYALGASEKIPISNTATLQEKPSKRKRKVVDGHKFLRSLNTDPIGLVVNKVNGRHQITYGSWNESRGNNAKLDNSRNVDPMVGVMTGMFGVAGGLLYYALSSGGNSAQSYGLHHRGMTTRALAVFNDQFEHVPAEGVQATIYHKIDYYNARREDTTPMLLFQFNDQIVYGSF
ncbi:MAG: hypothetical protein CMC08_05115, partial [Flavobacteriaceae bacterium]|nr:hypothetical protein [Flavobacteriaceae bacterium]